MLPPPRPTAEQLRASRNTAIPDLIGPGLAVLFCGINPSLYSAAVGHHFARPGNRFWPALHAGGFTPRRLFPWQQRELLQLRLGITNIVSRATAAAAELAPQELLAGRRSLERKVHRYRPTIVAVLGVGAYRLAFANPQADVGLQPQMLGGARLWVLPNPSGLNAHYQPAALARLFAELREAV